MPLMSKDKSCCTPVHTALCSKLRTVLLPTHENSFHLNRQTFGNVLPIKDVLKLIIHWVDVLLFRVRVGQNYNFLLCSVWLDMLTYLTSGWLWTEHLINGDKWKVTCGDRCLGPRCFLSKFTPEIGNFTQAVKVKAFYASRDRKCGEFLD
jgi:hypothetical protein